MGIGKYIRYIPYPVVSGFMTAIGVIILVTQLTPAMGYYPKEDAVFVHQFKPQAEEVLLENLLREEMEEGILVLEDFKTTIDRAKDITPEDIYTEAQTLAGKEASGVLVTLTILPKIFKNIQTVELLLVLLTLLIIYGFKRIATAVPSTLVTLFVVSGGAIFWGLTTVPFRPSPRAYRYPNGRFLKPWG